MDIVSIQMNVPWVEKYRPNQFDKIVLDPMNRQIFDNILKNKYFPNLLLYGPPGTGKTTTIINLINEFQARHFKINKSLVIHLNASDERGIDIIRNQIHSFVKTKNLFEVGLKFVILDEVDYMTKNAQHALKYLLQTCGQNVKFCLICNYISKIEDALQNEFACIRFNQLPKTDIYRFIRAISEKEGLNLSDETIDTIQLIYQSDIRSMINFIQLNQNLTSREWEGKVISQSVLETIHMQLINPNENASEIINCIHENSIQYNMDKITILHKYLDYVIRHKQECVDRTFLNIVSEIVHTTDAKPVDILTYFANILHTHFCKQSN
jgi:DNA polymerase III delta prime subunit